MADVRVALRVVDELLWVCGAPGSRSPRRRRSTPLAPSARSASTIGRGFAKRSPRWWSAKHATGRVSIAPSMPTSRAEPRSTLWERLAAKGFAESELDALREMLEALAAASPDSALFPLVHRGAELDRLLHLPGTARTARRDAEPASVRLLHASPPRARRDVARRDDLAGLRAAPGRRPWPRARRRRSLRR